MEVFFSLIIKHLQSQQGLSTWYVISNSSEYKHWVLRLQNIEKDLEDFQNETLI